MTLFRKDLNKKMHLPFTVGVVVFLALALRVAWLPDNLFFGFEQGRDFLKLREIVEGDLTLIGPKTDVEGIFHGALSYYILVVPFIFSGGNPFWVLASLITINALSIILLYRTVDALFSKKGLALLTIILYAVSYSSIIYSRWLSNPNLVPALTIGILYSLLRAKDDWRFFMVASLFWALVFHLEVIAAFILVVPIIIFILVERIRPTTKRIIVIIVTIFLILSPYFIFDLRHGHLFTKGVVRHLSESKSMVINRRVSFDQFSNEVVDNLYPTSRKLALALFLIVLPFCLWVGRKDKRIFLIVFFLISGPIIFSLLGIRPLRHFYITTPIFISITTAIAINYLKHSRFKWVAILIFLVIFFGNLITIFKRIPKNEANFLYHAQRTYLGDEKQLIDFVYREANDHPFSYDYFTIPYWKKEAWEYLFLWYGQETYGYLPSPNRTKTFYVLIEPDETQPRFQEEWYRGLTSDSVLISSFSSGKLTVEKRIQR